MMHLLLIAFAVVLTLVDATTIEFNYKGIKVTLENTKTVNDLWERYKQVGVDMAVCGPDKKSLSKNGILSVVFTGTAGTIDLPDSKPIKYVKYEDSITVHETMVCEATSYTDLLKELGLSDWIIPSIKREDYKKAIDEVYKKDDYELYLFPKSADNIFSVQDHLMHTHYFRIDPSKSSDPSEVTDELQKLGKVIKHPVFRHKEHIKLCPPQNVKDPFKSKFIVIEDSSEFSPRIVSICPNDTIKSALSRVYGTAEYNWENNDWTNWALPNFKFDLISLDFTPVIVKRTGDIPYTLYTSYVWLKGLVSSTSIEHVRNRLTRDYLFKSRYVGNKKLLLDEGGSSAFCSTDGTELASFPNPLAEITNGPGCKVLTVSIANRSDWSWLYIQNVPLTFKLTVCPRSTVKQVKERLARLLNTSNFVFQENSMQNRKDEEEFGTSNFSVIVTGPIGYGICAIEDGIFPVPSSETIDPAPTNPGPPTLETVDKEKDVLVPPPQQEKRGSFRKNIMMLILGVSVFVITATVIIVVLVLRKRKREQEEWDRT